MQKLNLLIHYFEWLFRLVLCKKNNNKRNKKYILTLLWQRRKLLALWKTYICIKNENKSFKTITVIIKSKKKKKNGNIDKELTS